MAKSYCNINHIVYLIVERSSTEIYYNGRMITEHATADLSQLFKELQSRNYVELTHLLDKDKKMLINFGYISGVHFTEDTLAIQMVGEEINLSEYDVSKLEPILLSSGFMKLC